MKNNLLFSRIKSLITFLLILLWGEKYFFTLSEALGIVNKRNKANFADITLLANRYRRRGAALGVDMVVGAILYLILNLFLFLTNSTSIIDKFDENFIILFLSLSIIFVQELIFCQTVGKKIMGLRIVTIEFIEPSKSKIILRNVIKFFVLHPISASVLIIVFLIDKNYRILDDIIANTNVITKNEYKDSKIENTAQVTI